MPKKEVPTFTIENMTMTARMSGSVDLDEVAASFHDVKFEPDKIVRAVISLRDPKATIGIYTNGKLVCMGIKSVEDGTRAFLKLEDLFQGHPTLDGLHIEGEPQVQNVLATSSLGFSLDLDDLSSHFEGANYDPTEFPGLIVKMNGSATATLYGSGKIIFMGVDSVERMREFVNNLLEKVRSLSTGANIVESEQT